MGECENVWAKDREERFREDVDRAWSMEEALWYLLAYSDAYSEAQLNRLLCFLHVWDNDKKKRFYLNRYRLKRGGLAIKEYMRVRDIFISWFADVLHNCDYLMIAPYDFISWAMERETIDVPAIMIEWKLRQDALAAGAKIETRGRPEEKLPEAAGKIIAALLASSGHKPDGRNTTSYVKSQINQIGLDAKPSTIKKQLQQTQAIIEK